MKSREASCGCGQLQLEVVGDPLRVSICHCLACQQRTGNVFSTQARFNWSQVVKRSGRSTLYVRVSEENGSRCTFHFCPDCGSTVFYVSEGAELPFTKDFVAIPVGAFADPQFPAPTVSVYEERRHSWVTAPDGPGVQHFD